jgi:hypothetical protein
LQVETFMNTSHHPHADNQHHYRALVVMANGVCLKRQQADDGKRSCGFT